MNMPVCGSRTSIMTVVRKSFCLPFFVVVDGVEKWAGEEGAQTLASGRRADTSQGAQTQLNSAPRRKQSRPNLTFWSH